MTTNVKQSHVINRAKIKDDSRLDAMTDADIAQAMASDPDAPALDLDWSKARLVPPLGKDIVTLRLDSDVLEWFRRPGQGLPDPHQPSFTHVLRSEAPAGR